MLADKIDDFYLGGGTPLSLYYFQHRESLDLDFFTREFDKMRISQIIDLLSYKLKKRIELISEQLRKERVKMSVFSLHIGRKESLKIDFIEDYLDFIKLPRRINGIKVLCLEDIYIRKIFAITGTFQTKDSVGRNITAGGRHEAKDFYDLYCLSSIFMRLSKFSNKFCHQLTREALIRWFRTYKRLDIKSGLLELGLKKDIEYNDMERHFKKEIDKILEKEVNFI